MSLWFLLATVSATSAAHTVHPMTPLQREWAAWNAVKRGDVDAYRAMLASSYVGVYSDGVFDKASEAASIRNDRIDSVRLGDFKTRVIDRDNIIVTYFADVKGTSSNKDVSGRYWEASTWHRVGSRWLGTSHMEVRTR